MLTTLSFLTFAVDMDYTHNRLQLMFTLILTSVAFKFVVNQALPRISYLTYLVCLQICAHDYIVYSIFQFMLTSLSFLTFAVAPHMPHYRLHLMFTLMLTVVAFKYVVNQALPKTSYLTYLVCHKLWN